MRLRDGYKRSARTVCDVEREYDREKYAACLQFMRTHSDVTPDALRSFELGDNLDRELCVSVGEDLYQTTLRAAWAYQDAELLRRIAPYLDAADIVCELGSGYGYALWLLQKHFPGKRYIGGDLSRNAVHIAETLFQESGGPVVQRVDLTEHEWCLPLSRHDRVCVFSSFAFHQLPLAASAVATLIAMKGERWSVCMFEPIYAWCSDTPLGRLRQEYTFANDYNRDLLDVLERHPNVTIEKTEKEFFGMNPLHPMSLVCWR